MSEGTIVPQIIRECWKAHSCMLVDRRRKLQEYLKYIYLFFKYGKK